MLILFGCAQKIIDQDIVLERLSTTDKPAKIAGMYVVLTEGSLLTTYAGAQITSIDGKPLPLWHGAVVDAGRRTVSLKYWSPAFATQDTTVKLDMEAGHSYLLLATGNVLKDRIVHFSIEDLDSGKIVFGRPPQDFGEPKYEAETARLRARFVAALKAQP